MEVVEKVKVALESSEDFSEPAIGFYTHQYADGREGVRYRLVTTAEDGLLIPYPEHNRFFINRELAQEYMDTHADLIDVIGYDEMVLNSMQEQSAYKRERTARGRRSLSARGGIRAASRSWQQNARRNAR